MASTEAAKIQLHYGEFWFLVNNYKLYGPSARPGHVVQSTPFCLARSGSCRFLNAIEHGEICSIDRVVQKVYYAHEVAAKQLITFKST